MKKITHLANKHVFKLSRTSRMEIESVYTLFLSIHELWDKVVRTTVYCIHSLLCNNAGSILYAITISFCPCYIFLRTVFFSHLTRPEWPLMTLN